MEDGGQAFPYVLGNSITRSHAGMSLRDWFAGQALDGILSNLAVVEKLRKSSSAYDVAAKAAYLAADAMLEARKA
jgi:hypothetical protein